MKNEPIEIFFVATEDYAPFVATTALSIVDNTKEQINFHVLTENFKDEDKIILKFFLSFFNASIEFIDVEEQLKLYKGLQLCWFKSYIPYARILIPGLTSLSKAIYMDLDIIVKCDIKELWDIDFLYEGKEYALAVAKGYKDNYAIENFGISPEHKYFCNGLLVLNCQKWRKEGIAEKLLKIATESKFQFRFPTQDVFNIVFDHNNYVAFDWKYNYMPKYQKEIDNHKIIHYVWDKPWEKENCGCSEYFWRVAKKTPYYAFFREKLQKNRMAKSKFAAKLREKINKKL
jgi:lipopolysaccharide biosynthesis glycosyltransferase